MTRPRGFCKQIFQQFTGLTEGVEGALVGIFFGVRNVLGVDPSCP